MLRWVGHDAVAVVDGGFKAWTDEGRDVEVGGPPPRPKARFAPQPRPEMLLDASAVARATQAAGFASGVSSPRCGGNEPASPAAGRSACAVPA
jgi:thiosulfate/3-mercaptopyruvate sulfurtransferase